MKIMRTIIPAAVILILGIGVACNKPTAAPVTSTTGEDAAKKAAEEEARRKAALAAEEDARRKAAEEARRKAEAEAAAEAARRAEAEKAAAYKKAAEAALKDINFDYDQSSIREADKPKLQAIADFLKAFPQAKLQIEGHCDERGTVEYNLALGERRAHAAEAYLISLGVAEGKLSIISYGKEKPKAQGHDEESWLANRRDEFKLQ